MSGKFNGLSPPKKLISSLYGNAKDTDEYGNKIDGMCGSCNEWDAELIDGNCRDDICKEVRLNKKVSDGKAIKYLTDIIASGGSGTVIERGTKRYFVKRK